MQTRHMTEHASSKTGEYPSDIPQLFFKTVRVAKKHLKDNKYNSFSLDIICSSSP